MRHMRLRLRRSVPFILAILSFIFCVAFYTVVWSTNELEQRELAREPPIPHGVVPFWSAINHPNIYDLHATPATTLFIRPPNVSPRRIAELFQLVRNARIDHAQSADKPNLVTVDPLWSFERLLAQQQTPVQDHINETNKQNPDTHIDSQDSAAAKTSTTTTLPPGLTTTEKTMSKRDKIQLRRYIHQVLTKWKEEHQNDKVVTLAEIMHDDLARDDPT
jgi:hypothetical protein